MEETRTVFGRYGRGGYGGGKRRLWLLTLPAALVLTVELLLAGCTFSKPKDEKVRDLEFTVAAEADVPDELRQIISEKKQQEFKLTYNDDQNLYIVVGYGPQPTGGYSIAVKELYLTDNAIVIDTELIGPEKGEPAAQEVSYPFVIVRTEYLEDPVVFR